MRFSANLKQLLFRILILLVIGAGVVTLVVTLVYTQQFLRIEAINREAMLINSFGVLSPTIVFGLITLNALIPPLPIPTPLVEIGAGVIFGFWPGFLLVWASQIISSLLAFWISRFFGFRYFNSLISRPEFEAYRELLRRRGPLAIILIRGAMASPFNIVSFLAGLTEMSTGTFTFAITLGTLPEAILFTLIGSTLRTVRVRLLIFYLLLIAIELGGLLFTAIFVRSFRLMAKKK